ncbi:MAG: NADP-dependent oxidoreductase [Candidatus Dormibacteraceae bacterium]
MTSSGAPSTTRVVRLAARPRGVPEPGDFEIAEASLAATAEGEVLVRNLLMSVDPYMRGRMGGVRTYVEPFQVGETLTGAAVGRIVESRAAGLAVGDLVVSQMGWRELFTSGPRGLRRLEPGPVPASAHLGVLGMPGFTAWYGVKEVGRPRQGETVFVSAASGAVGSVAGQLAKAGGCRVVGSAGSPEKVVFLLDELGFDAAFDYHVTPPLDGLREAAPEGIDLYFDNVGGAHLEAAIQHLHDFGRIVACGMISLYNQSAPAPGPANLGLVVTRRLRLEGFIITDHQDRFGEFLVEVAPLVAGGRLRGRETVVEGIERAPEALIGLFRGDNVGKMLVRLAADPGGTSPTGGRPG